jgi:hypothetical protein
MMLVSRLAHQILAPWAFGLRLPVFVEDEPGTLMFTALLRQDGGEGLSPPLEQQRPLRRVAQLAAQPARGRGGDRRARRVWRSLTTTGIEEERFLATSTDGGE